MLAAAPLVWGQVAGRRGLEASTDVRKYGYVGTQAEEMAQSKLWCGSFNLGQTKSANLPVDSRHVCVK